MAKLRIVIINRSIALTKAVVPILLTSSFTFSTNASLKNICSKLPSKENSKYLELSSYKADRLDKFASSVAVAKLADATLSKLIKAKSPLITRWMAKRELSVDNETKIILEWRLYYAKNFILGKYPHTDPQINKLTESLMNETFQKFMPHKLQSHFEKLFRKAQLAAIKIIKTYPFTASDKKKLLSRIQPITLYWMKDFKGSNFNKSPLELFAWGIAYNPAKNVIHMGLDALRYNSDSTIFTVFAHEIGHSFDSCRWGPFIGGANPFNKVIECLRLEKSVNAKKRDDSHMNRSISQKRLHPDLAKAMKLNPTCNNSSYPPPGVQADQVPESFADWFATEVVAQSDHLHPSFRLDLCRAKHLIPGSSYPPNSDRLSKIYFAHPIIKKFLKHTHSVKYCSITSAKPDQP